MNLKDKLIRRLLDIGKKHRILVYPTLALVAVISAISHAVYWGRGNGKRVVASVMIMALLITQSLFLTSSADTPYSPEGGNVASATDAGYVPEVENEDNYVNGENLQGGLSGSAGSGEQELYTAGDDKITVTMFLVDETDYTVAAKSIEVTEGDSFDLSQQHFYDDESTYFYAPEWFDDAGNGLTDTEITPEADDNNQFYCKLTRKQYNYRVIWDNGGSYGGTIDFDYADLTPGTLFPALEYTVEGFDGIEGRDKAGYDFTGVAYGDGVVYKIGDVITTKPNSYDYTLQLYPRYTPVEYDVQFDIRGNFDDVASDIELVVVGDETTSKTYTYSDAPSDTLPEAWAEAEGYYLKGWTDDDGKEYGLKDTLSSSDLSTPNADLSVSPNVTGKTFHAVWAYRDVGISVTGDNILSNDGQNAAISGTYGDNISCTVIAQYLGGDSGTGFTYSIDASATAMLSSYGLRGYQDNVGGSTVGKGFVIEGTVVNLTPDSGTVQFPITVTDTHHNNSQTTHTVTLDFGKRVVEIDPASVTSNTNDKAPYKTYDGTSVIGVGSRAEVSDKVGDDDVYIAISNQNAELKEINAGKNKDIILYGVTLEGADKDKYELKDLNGTDLEVKGAAKVDPKPISITMERVGEDRDVYFGEAAPEYRIVITDPDALVGDDVDFYNALTTDYEREAFMKAKLGFTEWHTDRKLYSSPGEYYIQPWFDLVDGSNYAAIAVPRDTFTVIREDADGKYTYSTEKGANGYYPGLAIRPNQGYGVRLLGDTDSDLTDDMTRSEAEALFSSVGADVPNMTDGVIRFQIMDYSNGSVTTIVSDTVSVDNTVPAYSSHAVEQADYMNEFNFGSYYHTHDGIERVKLTIRYTAEYSPCDELHYYFLDENGNKPGNIENTTAMTEVEPGVFEASITIGTGEYGQLIVYATNSAGGKSDYTRIKLSEHDTYSDPNYIPVGSSYYEWMVENNPAVVIKDSQNASIRVSTLNGVPVYGSSDTWYNGLDYSVKAEDEESGIWKIEWKITDPSGNTTTVTEDAKKEVGTVVKEYGKVTAYTFAYQLADEDMACGLYSVSAVLYDNAGNVTNIGTVEPYLIDSKKPNITDSDPSGTTSGNYQSDVSFKFTVTEGTDESGISVVKLYKAAANESGTDELIETWSIGDGDKFFLECSADIYANGSYKVVATDVAGNEAVYVKNYNNISVTAPEKPLISVDGTKGNNGWYIENPTVHISADAETVDGVPVTTSYRISDKMTSQESVVPNDKTDDYSFVLSKDGELTVEAWSQSKSGLKSETASVQIKVDTKAPDVEITSSTIDSNGDVIINFYVSDAESGVDVNQVKINGVPITVSDVDGVVTGSFKAEGAKEYTISVCDNAGNIADDKSFVPLGLKVNPIINITRDGAYLEAWVYEGTNEISDCYIAYKEASNASYTTALSNKHKESYGYSMNYTFNNLKADTVYDYKVYAITKVSKEVKTYEGSFRTNGNSAGGTIYGSAVYDDGLSDSYQRYPIFVSLYDANTFIASVRLENENDSDYTFKNIPDGSYRIVATDGLLTDTKAVTVENGGIRFPEDYAENGGVNFVLDGMSTRVVIEDNAINITADNLKSVFDTSVSEAVITPEDKAVLEAGGTIVISLHASYIDVSDISAEERGIFNAKLAGNTVIERYINLYVLKEVKDADGNYVNGTPVKLPELYNPITVSFPLGDLAGQNIYVAAVHGEGTNYSFMDWANADNVTLSQDSVTITTRYFSTYALYRVLPSGKSYTVTWKDGDGKTMKTETVSEGSSATPPTQIPTKTASANYTYSFSGWDTDYTSITKDTVISARFTAKRIEDSSNSGDKPADVSKNPNGYTYLGSADSPRTGDAAPIVLLVFIMAVSGMGMLVFKKRASK